MIAPDMAPSARRDAPAGGATWVWSNAVIGVRAKRGPRQPWIASVQSVRNAEPCHCTTPRHKQGDSR